MMCATFWLRSQHWKALKWVVENDYSKDSYIVLGAILAGVDIDLLRWLHSKNYIFDEDTFQYAARRGDLDIMKCLRSIECPWNGDTFHEAVVHDDLEILKWLNEDRMMPVE